MGRRRRGAMLGVLVSGLVGGALHPAAAPAALYHLYSCHTPYGDLAPTDGWRGSTNGPFTYAIDDCRGQTTGALTAALDGQVAHAANLSNAIWAFTAAPSLNLAGAALYRREALPGGVGADSTYVTYLAAPNLLHDAADAFDGCQANAGCTALGTDYGSFDPSNRVVVPESHISGANHLFMEAYCGGTNGRVCPGSPGYAAEADLYAADLTVEDGVAPAVSRVGGPLLAGGTLTGRADVTFTASDLGSGVYSAQLRLDGQLVSTQVIDGNGGRCQTVGQAADGLRDFLYQAPCKPSVSADVWLDTSRLGDGPHNLEVSVDDAAGNIARVYTGPIITRNAAGGGATGPGAAHVANGSGGCGAARLTASFRSGPIGHAGLRGRARVHGALDCAGHRVAGAAIEVSIARRGSHRDPSRAEVRTAADGSFAFVLAPGPSRDLALSYRAFSDDPAPAATARARLLVTPSIRLAIRPGRVRNGQRITYRGEVSGGYIPASGLPLVVQYRDGRNWRTFDQTRARAKDGRFVYHYTFRRTTMPIVYTFRVAIPPGGVTGYPYAPTGSRPRSVRVDP